MKMYRVTTDLIWPHVFLVHTYAASHYSLSLSLSLSVKFLAWLIESILIRLGYTISLFVHILVYVYLCVYPLYRQSIKQNETLSSE